MSFSESVDQLIDAFRHLPSIGPKSAQKMVMHLLEHDRTAAERIAQCLRKGLDTLSPCQDCQVICESDKCHICADAERDGSVLCVVQNQADLQAFEQLGEYFGKYFVLQDLLSPIDGIGPEQIGAARLIERLKDGEIKELILALPASTEGDITGDYLCTQFDSSVKVSRLAKGIPSGIGLESVDAGTLSFALNARKER